MRKIDYLIVSEDGSCQPGDPRLHELRHYHIVDGSTLSHKALINELLRLRSHYPEAKIFGMQEIVGASIQPNERMNALRRALSDYP